MRKPFDGEYRITQIFNDECCRDSYTKFNLIGHNGIDYATPSGTRIIAPHNGKIIEATLDAVGYGIYIKIENATEGSVLAHLREHRIGVGDGVNEGDLIGYSDNSGNSTGPHLHWGYYRFPRDRSNGFNGFIDQTPYIGTNSNDNQAIIDQLRAERDTNWNLYQQERNAKIDLEDQLDKKNKANLVLEKMVQDKDKEIISLQGSIQGLTDLNKKLSEEKATTQAELVKTTMDLEICLAQRKDLAKYETKELINEVIGRFFRKRVS